MGFSRVDAFLLLAALFIALELFAPLSFLVLFPFGVLDCHDHCGKLGFLVSIQVSTSADRKLEEIILSFP